MIQGFVSDGLYYIHMLQGLTSDVLHTYICITYIYDTRYLYMMGCITFIHVYDTRFYI